VKNLDLKMYAEKLHAYGIYSNPQTADHLIGIAWVQNGSMFAL